MTAEHLQGTVDDIRRRLREQFGWKNVDRLNIPDPATIPATAFTTDKYIQGYMPVYERLCEELGTAARICEVGVCWGGSLGTWQVLFPEGLIAGVDIDPVSYWPDGTIKIVMAQEDPALADVLRGYCAAWDMIIDDASHEGWRTAATFNNLWPLVRPGGYYVIEDWFYGWHEGQRDTYNMTNVARDMLDFLDGSHDIDEIRYRYGMIIVKKVVRMFNLPQIMVELEKMRDANPLRAGQFAPSNGEVPGA